MKLLQCCILFLGIFFISCSTVFDSSTHGVRISSSSDKLTISNYTHEKIYYFVVEQQILAVLEWSPSISEPSIKSRESLKIPFSEILNGKTEPVQPGDKVVAYWWTADYQDFSDLHTEVISI